jgi:ADP-ribosyl-[dinitrogen reductase] hydrolase
VQDRRRGALLGLAIGDALGAAVEFCPPGTFEPVTGFRSGGPHRLEAGEWTDDTSMALALAASLAECGWDLNDQAARYVRWWRNGEYSVNDHCFDIGFTTRASLMRFEEYGDARYSASSEEGASGNGSIMRLAPIPIRFVHLFPDQISQLGLLAAESSRPTHASPQCLCACRYLALILCGLMHGIAREEVLDPQWEPLGRLRSDRPLHPAVDEVAAGSFRHRSPPAIRGSGYVVKSLEAALWAFHRAADFREAVLNAVNLGDDADTTGAVAGQLAGACWGVNSIPPEWLNGLAGRDRIEGAVRALTADVAG